MDAGSFMLIAPIFIVVLIFFYMAYVYFTQYRHATPDGKVQLRNKFFGSSNRYQLTEADNCCLVMGHYNANNTQLCVSKYPKSIYKYFKMATK